jgi:hypothetical protein
MFRINCPACLYDPLVLEETTKAFSAWAHERPHSLNVLHLDKAKDEVEWVRSAFDVEDSRLRQICGPVGASYTTDTIKRRTPMGDDEYVIHSTFVLDKSSLDILHAQTGDELLQSWSARVSEKILTSDPGQRGMDRFRRIVVEPSRKPRSRDLVIRCLPPGTDEDKLVKMLCPYGKINKVTILPPHTQNSLVLAFVSFENPSRAMELMHQCLSV